jgi:4-hydroxy-3-polyprenylbenzoate decarboxylase
MRLIVGLSGASGIVYGIRLLQVLREKNVQTELVMTLTAKRIVELETDCEVEEIPALATRVHGIDDLEAPISSGGYLTDGMIVAPCSMKTLAGIACGYSANLLLRVADVTLKEKRPLVLVPRETPLNIVHLENMLQLARIGVTILPAMPAFYHRPQTIDQLTDFVVGKVLDVLHIEHNLCRR